MNLLLWLAMTATGIQQFPGMQEACAASVEQDKGGRAVVVKVESVDTKVCCLAYVSEIWNPGPAFDGWIERCEGNPSRFNCSPVPPTLTRLACVASPSYTTEPVK